MRMRWERLRSEVRHSFSSNRRHLKRAYWTCAVLLVVFLFAVPLYLGVTRPHVVVLDPFHPNVVAAQRRWQLEFNRVIREETRVADFAMMFTELQHNYPFFEAAARATGIDYEVLALDVFDELVPIARDDPSPVFMRDFINERFLYYLQGLGNVRVANQAVTVDWIHHPYFFGHADWRFADERQYVPVREDNIQLETLETGVAYMRINTFVAKGYEDVTRHPFWYFCPETEGARLLDYFATLDNYSDLIIDIRGNANNFARYFVPYLLAPLIDAPINAQFYAFHMQGYLARRVSYAYREWLDLGDRVSADKLSGGFAYPLPAGIVSGFPVPVSVTPVGDVGFGGRVWLVVDSNAFSGPNFMYLQLAQEAGFTLVYQENPDATGWDTTFTGLVGASLVLRYNPLFFTDTDGRSLEEAGAFYDYRLPAEAEGGPAVWRFLAE